MEIKTIKYLEKYKEIWKNILDQNYRTRKITYNATIYLICDNLKKLQKSHN